jgi:hypothetical protein
MRLLLGLEFGFWNSKPCYHMHYDTRGPGGIYGSYFRVSASSCFPPLLCDGDWSLEVFNLHSLQRFRVLPSYAYHTLRQYGNVVGTSKCIIFYIGDPIFLLGRKNRSHFLKGQR